MQKKSKSKLKTELSLTFVFCLSLATTSQGMRKKTHIVYIANLVSLAVCCLEYLVIKSVHILG